MRVAAIGRTEILYNTIELLIEQGHEIALIVTTEEAPEYTKKSEDFKQLAEKLGAEFIHTGKIKTIVEPLKAMEPIDVAVSVNYSGIIPNEVINCFRLCILNAHGGDLPRYRGNACQAWAIINGEDRIGLCIHRMDEKLDSGDIIVRDYISIDHNKKVTEVLNWFSERVPEMFLEAIIKLAKNPDFVLQRQSADPKDALRCYPRRPEDGRIDWRKPAIDVLRLINASNKPYAGAYCEFEGKKMIIWDAKLVDHNGKFCAVPGQVTFIGESFVEIACDNGKLKLIEVEYMEKTKSPNCWVRSLRERLN